MNINKTTNVSFCQTHHPGKKEQGGERTRQRKEANLKNDHELEIEDWTEGEKNDTITTEIDDDRNRLETGRKAIE